MRNQINSNVFSHSIQSSGVVARCLRSLADMAERHHREKAQRHEVAHLTDTLKHDIVIVDTPSPCRDSLPVAMNSRFQLSL